MHVVTNRREKPVDIKIGTCAEGSGIISPKINLLTTSNYWKENERVYNVKTNFESKQIEPPY